MCHRPGDRGGRANKARLNRSPVRSTREVVGVLQAVLFAPEDLALVRGDPADRRRYSTIWRRAPTGDRGGASRLRQGSAAAHGIVEVACPGHGIAATAVRSTLSMCGTAGWPSMEPN